MRLGTVLVIIVFLILPHFSLGQANPYMEHEEERRKMVEHDILSYPGLEIHDTAIIDALLKVPRHAFIPSELKAYAYLNRPIPIGFGQTISQPVIVASMTQLLSPVQGQRILEIGTGSGYQAAILGELGCEVYSIEIVPELGQRAMKILKTLGYENVHVKVGDGYYGWPEVAPFDRIIVTCAPEEVPTPLVEQLKPSGRIVIPVGKEDQVQYLLVMKKSKKGTLSRELKYPVRFVPMTGEASKK